MYHFYRQDESGMWSHKDGGSGITNLVVIQLVIPSWVIEEDMINFVVIFVSLIMSILKRIWHVIISKRENCGIIKDKILVILYHYFFYLWLEIGLYRK